MCYLIIREREIKPHRKGDKKMRYFVNIITGALAKDFIFPAYRAYWREISEKEYKERMEKA